MYGYTNHPTTGLAALLGGFRDGGAGGMGSIPGGQTFDQAFQAGRSNAGNDPNAQVGWQPGNDPDRALEEWLRDVGRREEISGRMDSLGNRFRNVGGGPISALPRPYAGPPLLMGRDNGMGLQMLIAQMLQGRR